VGAGEDAGDTVATAQAGAPFGVVIPGERSESRNLDSCG
jgi:hypothetical protein